jgi:hypothetical protein
MNKRQRKKKVYSIKQEHNIMFGSPQRKPHGWCMD